MGDFFSWYGDLWARASHGLGTLILLGIAHFVVLLVVLGALAGVSQLGRAFSKGWREPGD